MARASCLLGILAITAGAVPGCSGNQFTSADESEAGDAGEAGAGAVGGSGGTSGKGGSSSGTAGSDVGGNGTGGAGRGGTSGTSSGGSQTGGDAGDGASGGSGPGGMGGSSGTMGGTFPTGGTAGTFPTGGTAGAFPTGGTAGAGSGGAGSGGKGGTSGSGGAGPSMCPPSAPSPNSACSFMGHCSYGTHPLQRCRDVYACDGVHWQQTQDANCATPQSCQELPTPPIVNAQCMPEGAECQGNLYCLCAPNCSTVCSVPPIWHCFGTPGDCPAVLPNRGQPCNVNLSCVYGSCASQTGVQAICENGFWVWYGLLCPQ